MATTRKPKLNKKKVGAKSQAAAHAVKSTDAYVLILNRLADKKLSSQVKVYTVAGFRDKTSLTTHMTKRIHITAKGGPPPKRGRIVIEVCMDQVGILPGCHTQAVMSKTRSKPIPIKRIRGKSRSQVWHADLRDLLSRDIVRDPMTVQQLMNLHEPDVTDPEGWLFGKPEDVEALEKDILDGLQQKHVHTTEWLIDCLKDWSGKARRLRYSEKYNNYRTLQGWCRTVNRNVFDKECKQDWLVKAPHARAAKISTPLLINDLNCASIDFRSASRQSRP